MCICMAESLHCSPETITALSNGYACMLSHFSHVGLFAPPVARQGPLSMGFSRQEYWSGLPLPSPKDLPDPGIESRSPALQADSLSLELQGNPDDVHDNYS